MRTVLTPFRADAFSLACPPKHAFTHESAGNFRSACLCFPQWQRRRPGIQDRACTLAFGASEGPALSLAFSGRTCLGTPALLGIARGRLQSRRSPWVSLWDPRTPCGFVRWREASPHAPSRTRFATGMPYHDKPYFVYANRAFASRSGGFARGARTVEDAVLHGLGLLVDAEDGARGDVGVHVGRAVERVEHRHVPAARAAAAAASAGLPRDAAARRRIGGQVRLTIAPLEPSAGSRRPRGAAGQPGMEDSQRGFSGFFRTLCRSPALLAEPGRL